jgi:hypothetical protein
VNYNKDAPLVCGKSVLYAGAVITVAQDAELTRAKDLARQAAKTMANDNAHVGKYRDKSWECPKECRHAERVLTGQEVALTDVKDVIFKQIRQATGEPYVAYAFVPWMVKVSCPSPP